MKLSALRLQAPTQSKVPSSKDGATTADLLGKLQTAEGQKLLGQLVEQIKPHTDVADLILEPTSKRTSPTDRFESKLVDNLFNQFITHSEVRTATVAAVAAEFQALADTGGLIDAKTVQHALGPKGLQFFEALKGIQGKSGDPLADRRAFGPLGSITAAAVAKDAPIAPKMAALEIMLKQVAKQDELKGFSFMGLQHLFASSATMFDGIHSLGVEHDDMRFIGKVYSTNHRVVAELESRGATVDHVSKKVGAKDFGEAMGQSIEWQLAQIIDTLPRPTIFGADGATFTEAPRAKVLLIDDGAEAIKVLHEKFPAYAPFFVCVEQTRRGARILHDMQEKGELKCAVANVAETWAKLEWESPMIGHSVVLEVDRKLDRLEKSGVAVPRESLVLGCGAVGGGVARAMVRRGLDIHLYDKDPTRSTDLKAAMVAEGLDTSKIHVHTDKQSALAHAGVLVSCVGVRTIDRDDHAFLPDGAILVNAASADDELGPQDLLPFRKKNDEKDERGNLWNSFRGQAVNIGKADAEAHSDAVVTHPNGKQFLVVNNGYVVNMTGERDPIPPRYIQLTRTLLLLGALTAKRAAEGEGGTVSHGAGAGLHDVPREWQEALVHLVQRELKKTGEDLKKPNWDTKAADAFAPEERLTPPADVVAQAALERTGAAPLPEAPLPASVKLRIAKELALRAATQVPQAPKAVDGRSIYGLSVGKTMDGSIERSIAKLVDGDSVLSLEGAALYQATIAINQHFGVSLRASLKAPGGQQSPLFVDKANVQFSEGKLHLVDSDETPKERFEGHFGHFCRVLVGGLLAQRLKRAPTEAEVGQDLKALLANQSVDVTPWLQQLGRSADPADQALLKTLS